MEPVCYLFLDDNHQDVVESGLESFLRGFSDDKKIDLIMSEGPADEFFIKSVNDYLNSEMTINQFFRVVHKKKYTPNNNIMALMAFAKKHDMNLLLIGQENEEMIINVNNYLTKLKPKNYLLIIGSKHDAVVNYL